MYVRMMILMTIESIATLDDDDHTYYNALCFLSRCIYYGDARGASQHYCMPAAVV